MYWSLDYHMKYFDNRMNDSNGHIKEVRNNMVKHVIIQLPGVVVADIKCA